LTGNVIVSNIFNEAESFMILKKIPGSTCIHLSYLSFRSKFK